MDRRGFLRLLPAPLAGAAIAMGLVPASASLPAPGVALTPAAPTIAEKLDALRYAEQYLLATRRWITTVGGPTNEQDRQLAKVRLAIFHLGGSPAADGGAGPHVARDGSKPLRSHEDDV